MGCKPLKLVGRKFGRLEVIAFVEVKDHVSRWLCRCDCGTEKVIRSRALMVGRTKSCGCLAREKSTVLGSKSRLFTKLPDGVAGRNKAYSRYVQNARKRKIDFLLTVEQSELLFTGNCFYCGKAPSMVDWSTGDSIDGNSAFIHNGIDRVDNTKGYTLENCVPCCKKCNNLKQGVTVEIARKIVEFMDGKELNAKAKEAKN